MSVLRELLFLHIIEAFGKSRRVSNVATVWVVEELFGPCAVPQNTAANESPMVLYQDEYFVLKGTLPLAV